MILNAITWAVTVLPTFAPMITPMDCSRDMRPAEMNPTSSTVVTVEDWMTARDEGPAEGRREPVLREPGEQDPHAAAGHRLHGVDHEAQAEEEDGKAAQQPGNQSEGLDRLVAGPLHGPRPGDLAQSPTPLQPLEPSDTSSPAATLNSLIDACNTLLEQIQSETVADQQSSELLPTKERILDCLDLTELPKELRSTAGIESALFLKEVLDRITLPDDDAIPSGEPPGSTGEPQRDQWRIPRTRITISSIPGSSQPRVYLFSAETVRRAAEFFGWFVSSPIDRRVERYRRVCTTLTSRPTGSSPRRPRIPPARAGR